MYDTNGEQPLSAMISMITKVCPSQAALRDGDMFPEELLN